MVTNIHYRFTVMSGTNIQKICHQYLKIVNNSKSGFEITTEIVHDSHNFQDKIVVVHDFLRKSKILYAFFEGK